MISRLSLLTPSIVTSCWGLLVGAGMLQMYTKESMPDSAADAPATYPTDSHLDRQPTGSSLLLFVHPHCPCAHASIDELERIMSRSGDLLRASVIFWHPVDAGVDWHKTRLWERACGIPGVRVLDDVGCTLTRQFGAATSGQVLLYDRADRLQFAGGITQARGHAGDNFGSDAILKLMRRDSSESAPTTCCSVFGCPLIEKRQVEATAGSN